MNSELDPHLGFKDRYSLEDMGFRPESREDIKTLLTLNDPGFEGESTIWDTYVYIYHLLTTAINAPPEIPRMLILKEMIISIPYAIFDEKKVDLLRIEQEYQYNITSLKQSGIDVTILFKHFRDVFRELQNLSYKDLDYYTVMLVNRNITRVLDDLKEY